MYFFKLGLAYANGYGYNIQVWVDLFVIVCCTNLDWLCICDWYAWMKIVYELMMWAC